MKIVSILVMAMFLLFRLYIASPLGGTKNQLHSWILQKHLSPSFLKAMIRFFPPLQLIQETQTQENNKKQMEL